MLILVAHGSRVAGANREVQELANAVASKSNYDTMAAFLEIASPNIADAVDAAVKRRPSKIIVLPYFLTQGLHVQRDIRAQVSEQQARHPEISIQLLSYIGSDARLTDLILDILNQAEKTSCVHQ